VSGAGVRQVHVYGSEGYAYLLRLARIRSTNCFLNKRSGSQRNQIPDERLDRVGSAILKNNLIGRGSLYSMEANMTPKISPELMYLIIAAVAFVLINR
jgi:hypothetical protein